MRFVLVVLCCGLGACVSAGSIAGRLVVKDQAQQDVRFDFESDRFGTGGRMWVTLPGGESYSGRYVQITQGTEVRYLVPYYAGWSRWDRWGPYGRRWIMGEDWVTFRQNYSNRVVATLFGNEGNSMRCRFELTNLNGNLTDGAVGECELSTGARIEAQL